MHVPRLSVSLPYWQNRDPLDALQVAEAADDLGYDRLWIGEMATFDAFALATAIGRTPGLPLCLGPLAVPVRSPATIAMGVASVAALTGRTVDIALGTSSTVVVRNWHGRERRRTARHLEESARIVRALLNGEKAEYDGAAEHIHGFRLRLPSPAPEVALAAFGDRALEVAARTGDRVVLNLVTPAQVARCVAAVAEFAKAADRPAPPTSVWVTAAESPDAEMLATLRRGVVGYLRAPGYDAMFTEAGFGETVALARGGAHPRDVLSALPDELPAAVGMFGTGAALAARLHAYYAAGADEVVVVPVTSIEDPAGRRTLETLADIAAVRGGRANGFAGRSSLS